MSETRRGFLRRAVAGIFGLAMTPFCVIATKVPDVKQCLTIRFRPVQDLDGFWCGRVDFRCGKCGKAAGVLVRSCSAFRTVRRDLAEAVMRDDAVASVLELYRHDLKTNSGKHTCKACRAEYRQMASRRRAGQPPVDPVRFDVSEWLPA